MFRLPFFVSKPAQARRPQLDVRLRLAPPCDRRLDRAVGLRGGDVDVVVELIFFCFLFFFFEFFEFFISREKRGGKTPRIFLESRVP